MTGSRRALKILVPLCTLAMVAVFLEFSFRVYSYFKKPFTPQDQERLMARAESLYPPDAPLFATFCSDRPLLPARKNDVMGQKLREYEYPRDKPAGVFRIAGLGDSFAWGFGVPDNRQTMFKLLECWLNRERTTGRVELINCSKPGAGINYYEHILNGFVFGLKPDLVVMVFNLNDPYIYDVSIEADRRAARTVKREASWLLRTSRLLEFIRFRFKRLQMTRESVGKIKRSYAGDLAAGRWEKAKTDLLRIAAQCRERNIRLQVTIFPLLVGLEDKTYLFADEVAMVESFLKSSQISCLSLLPLFKGKKSETLWVDPQDTHPNRVAHRLAATALYRDLVREKLLPDMK